MSDNKVIVYLAETANGWPITDLLEELKATYGAPEYEVVKMSIRDGDIGKLHNQVKQPWFLQINPNGRIPALTHAGFNVFETSAILLYLVSVFDTENKFGFDPKKNPKEYSEELQWLFFAHGGIGPMQGQANHFSFAAPEKIPYAINRYVNETKRLYSVLNTRLANREYLVGPAPGTYNIADIKTWRWVRRSSRINLDLNEFPNIKAWVERIEAKPTSKASEAALTAAASPQ